MSNKAVRSMYLSQLCPAIGIVACTILMPHFLFEKNEGGMSNYAVHLRTVVPYTLAFVLSSIFLVLGANALHKTGPSQLVKRFRNGIYGLAALLLLGLLSTYAYQHSNALTNLHLAAALLIFWYELIFSIWMVLTIVKTRLDHYVLLLQFVGFGLGLLTDLGDLHVLFIAQIITALAFGIVLIRTTIQIVER